MLFACIQNLFLYFVLFCLGLQAFSKLRVLDVSFNCIVALSELTPLAYLHDLISVSNYNPFSYKSDF